MCPFRQEKILTTCFHCLNALNADWIWSGVFVSVKSYKLMCQRKYSGLSSLPSFVSFFSTFFTLKKKKIDVLITEKLKDLEIDNSARFSAMIMGFLLLEQRIRRTFLSLLRFLFPFWITKEMSWVCSLDNKIYFSITSEYLNWNNFPLNPSPFLTSQYPWFKVGMQLQGFCVNLTFLVVSKNSTPDMFNLVITVFILLLMWFEWFYVRHMLSCKLQSQPLSIV